MIAVRDLRKARDFYEGVLGLEPVRTEGEEVIVFASGSSTINVYRSQYAGTNQATALTWAVDGDLEKIVRALRAKGVTFEHYDMPGLTLEGDIHVGEGLKVAWFKDPGGNILSIASR
jgi:catechol 2,3-dioxygenase-like lactoylglutathione lyase family enzyme